jgi:Asp-tRNA(Asn)/Glu-tRNA(Gln) amidotransferase A subunit family amidase
LNPLNLAWSPGGSSGGSASAIAAGLVPIATATDAGGSVRGPAGLCGLIGLKPTNGLIGRSSAPEWLDLVTDGILATSAADARLLLSVLAGPQPGDPTAAPWPAHAAVDGMPRRLLVAHRIQAGPALASALEEVFHAAVGRLADALRLLPLEVDPASIFPGAHHPDDDSLILLEAETVQWLGRDRIVREREFFDPFFARYLDEALAVTLDQYVAARRRRFDHARALDALLGPDAILVTPIASISGLLADGSVPAEEGALTNGAANTNPHNVTGHPAISLPAGRTAAGVGFGIQVTGPRYGDGVLLDVAEAWERVAPWPLSAPGFTPFGGGRA